MSGHKPFVALNSRDNYFVKAFYFADGQNELIRAISNPAFTAAMRVDAIEFARLYSEQFKDADHVINVSDCLNMFRAGKTEFKRD